MDIKIFTGSNGLNTRVDPVRIAFNPETGICDLSVATNIDHDETGRISRRKGYRPVLSVGCHSLWADSSYIYFVSNKTLYRSDGKDTADPLCNLKHNGQISYVSAFGKVFWSNGVDRGYVLDDTNGAWEAVPYVGVDTKRKFMGPPAGRILSYHNGRVIVCVNNEIWFSEPFNPFLFDSVRNLILFEGDILSVHSISSGLIVSDTTGIYFVSGTDLSNVDSITKTSVDRIVPGTVIDIDLTELSSSGMGAIFVTNTGICMMTKDGSLTNMTKKKIVLPNVTGGTATIADGKYIAILSMGES